jgi:2-hydroxy-3-keto-5-methylthiopentenyl-1-phosphate phosphatase
MQLASDIKTLIQCDFDGTITEGDISFLILDEFATGDWRQLLAQYKEKKISVGCFNTKAFTMIKEDKQTLERFVREKARIKAGFFELLTYCQQRGFRFVIVSNGLDFYIRTILDNIGVDNIEVYAAQARFGTDCIETRYLGPEDTELHDDFKEAYTRYFLKSGYRVIYVGNGASDASSAYLTHHVFATGPLLAYCQETKLNCTHFNDLNDVVKGLKILV